MIYHRITRLLEFGNNNITQACYHRKTRKVIK